MDPFLKQHVRYAAIFTTLVFALLAGALGYWQLAHGDELFRKPDNRHRALLERHIRRGSICDLHGAVLASSPSSGGPGSRRYPYGALCAHVLGYLSVRYGRTGIEGALDAALSGLGPNPSAFDLNPMLTGARKQGDSVYLTIDLATQKAASAALGNRRGAVVAIEPSTGRILALVSHPSFDPGTVDEDWLALNRPLPHHRPGPLLDRAIQEWYQPGSTFKVLTAAAAIATGTYRPTDEFYCPGYIVIDGHTIHEMDGEVHGHLDLAQALAQSCNVTFAQVGIKLGAETLVDYASRFWVDRPLTLLPPQWQKGRALLPLTGQIIGSVSTGGSSVSGSSVSGSSVSGSSVSRPAGRPQASGASVRKPNLKLMEIPTILAQTAFGQGQVAITPLEDCMIDAAIANGGRLMKPYLVEKVVDPAGKTVWQAQPALLSQPVDAATAATVTSMMELTFTEGTARHLQVPGLLMAGKTGTAQNPHGATHAWFVGFAPAQAPQVVVACVVENGGVGGVAAGPVVRSAILAALRYHIPGR